MFKRLWIRRQRLRLDSIWSLGYTFAAEEAACRGRPWLDPRPQGPFLDAMSAIAGLGHRSDPEVPRLLGGVPWHRSRSWLEALWPGRAPHRRSPPLLLARGAGRPQPPGTRWMASRRGVARERFHRAGTLPMGLDAGGLRRNRYRGGHRGLQPTSAEAAAYRPRRAATNGEVLP